MVFAKPKILQQKQVDEYKMTEREIYKNFTNLRRQKLNKEIIKILMPEMISWLLLLNDVEEKKQEV